MKTILTTCSLVLLMACTGNNKAVIQSRIDSFSKFVDSVEIANRAYLSDTVGIDTEYVISYVNRDVVETGPRYKHIYRRFSRVLHAQVLAYIHS